MAAHANGAGIPRRPLDQTRGSRSALAILVALALAGCSYVPDWANPIEWYDDLTGDSVPPPPEEVAPARTGSDRPFPTLGSVPERPAVEATEEQRTSVAAGLEADRDNARYTDEVLRANPNAPPPAPPLRSMSDSASPTPPPPAPPITVGGQTAVQPAPIAQPMPAPEASAPADAPVSPSGSVQMAAAMPAPATGPVARPDVGPNQQALSDAFSQSLSESAATVITAPTHSGFTATTSQPISAQQSSASPLIRQNYNESLAQQPASMPSQESQVASLPSAPAAVVAFDGRPIAVVKFANGSAKLSQAGLSEIERAVNAHKSRGGRIRVIGHASRRTRDLSASQHKLVNFRLSVERAQVVANELMRKGVPAESIIVEARGADDPVYYEWMPAGEAENRRADIYLQ